MRVCVAIGGLSRERAAAASYVLQTLLDALGLPHAPEAGDECEVALAYGPPAAPAAGGAIVEIACGGSMTADEAIRIYRRVASGDPAIVTREGPRVRVGADIVAAAAFWLTGGEEQGAPRDAFGRVRGESSPRHAAGLLATPVVHDLMALLWRALAAATEGAGLRLERAPAWPDGHRFAVLLSHDVDLWRKRTARGLAKELLRSICAPRRLGQVARAFCRGPDPWSDLDAIADLEEARGMRSTFFVLPGRPDRDVGGVHVVNSYAARPEAVRATLRRIAARGFEIALHASFDSFASADALAGERRDVAALCGGEVRGCRQHFLRLDWPATWRAQADAGLACDATLGYHDTDGYRAGFSFPFRPFGGTSMLPVLELPLAIYDGGLHEYQGLDAEAAWERLRGYLERTEADGAMLGLLWHNTHFCELDAPGYRGVYERALDWIRGHGGWGASARQLCDWWLERSARLAAATP